MDPSEMNKLKRVTKFGDVEGPLGKLKKIQLLLSRSHPSIGTTFGVREMVLAIPSNPTLPDVLMVHWLAPTFKTGASSPAPKPKVHRGKAPSRTNPGTLL